MLHSLTALRKFHVHAADGDIGEVTDAYFDDERWVLRYLVVNTGSWLSGREVLISAYSVSRLDDAGSAIVTLLTRQQIERSPSIDTAKPISRQQEESYLSYFGYPVYWPYTTLWAWGAMPVVVPPDPRLQQDGPGPAGVQQPASGPAAGAAAGPRDTVTASSAARQGTGTVDVHLRSGREVTGYHIQGSDDAVGHVEDFLFEDGTWAVRYLAVDTRNWLPGRHVLISTQWIREVSWPERLVVVQLSREEIESSPQYDPKHLPTRGEEANLHRHYRRPDYWS